MTTPASATPDTQPTLPIQTVAKYLLKISLEAHVDIRKYLLERGIDYHIGFTEEVFFENQPPNPK